MKLSTQRHRGETGSTTLEVAVVFPAVLLLVLLVIQAALYWHARSVALSAAQQGLAVAEVSGLPAGQARASAMATQLGGLHNPSVTGSRAGVLTVVVTGGIPSFVPGLQATVTESAAGRPESYETPAP